MTEIANALEPSLLWDDLFHACALEAYLTVAAETNSLPPDQEKTRLLAYRLFEERLPYSKGSFAEVPK